MPNHATEKELNDYATGVDAPSLATKSGFIALKAEADKLDFSKLLNVPTGSNNLKTKVDDLDAGCKKFFLQA